MHRCSSLRYFSCTPSYSFGTLWLAVRMCTCLISCAHVHVRAYTHVFMRTCVCGRFVDWAKGLSSLSHASLPSPRALHTTRRRRATRSVCRRRRSHHHRSATSSSSSSFYPIVSFIHVYSYLDSPKPYRRPGTDRITGHF